jgi:hypothetical protein
MYLESSLLPPEPSNGGRLLEFTASGTLSQLLPLYRLAPIVGVEFVLEVVNMEEGEGAAVCFLCDVTSDLEGLMYHLLSARHRLAYLVNFYFHLIAEVPPHNRRKSFFLTNCFAH